MVKATLYINLHPNCWYSFRERDIIAGFTGVVPILSASYFRPAVSNQRLCAINIGALNRERASVLNHFLFDIKFLQYHIER